MLMSAKVELLKKILLFRCLSTSRNLKNEKNGGDHTAEKLTATFWHAVFYWKAIQPKQRATTESALEQSDKQENSSNQIDVSFRPPEDWIITSGKRSMQSGPARPRLCLPAQKYPNRAVRPGAFLKRFSGGDF